jgi:large-conductance mechanosensitive channel
MAFKEQLIVRTAVGTLLGLAINSFLSSVGNDVIKPIISRKSFDKLEHEFVATIFGIKINYGDLLGHFFSMVTVILVIYLSLMFFERYRIL